ncbi:nucleotide exchange factor GrpE [Salsuginibacillus kocurii]|uniref:nucleotide exchange factor GrpE n=1 Tax=Salsuginibacillus kocurii TaxID=427078 RepID=UPI000364E30A|nr:nucleotide exchange factor GrpE [Salsuginibacillus kocurii]
MAEAKREENQKTAAVENEEEIETHEADGANDNEVSGEILDAEEDAEDVTTEDEDPTVKLEEEVEEWKSKAARVQADYENFRRRQQAEKETLSKYRSQKLGESLLPVLDNFERALQSAPEDEASASFVEGMEMVYKQLHQALAEEGIEEVEAEGAEFDPHQHQAVMQAEDDNYESNQVIEVMQKGYKLKDRVIRPAMVKVNA